jgi:hypothetical protein
MSRKMLLGIRDRAERSPMSLAEETARPKLAEVGR